MCRDGLRIYFSSHHYSARFNLAPTFFFCWQVLAKCTSERDPDDYVLMLKLKEGGKKTNLFGTSKKGYKVGTITQ